MAIAGVVRRFRWSAARTIVLAILAISTLLLGIQGGLDYQSEALRQSVSLGLNLGRISGELSHSLALPLWDYDSQQMRSVLEGAMSSNRFVCAIIVRDAHQGKEMVRLGRDAEWRPAAGADDGAPVGRLLAQAEIIHQGARIGSVEVRGTDRFERQALRDSFIKRMASILAVNLLLIALLYLVFRRIVVTPLQALEAFALHVSRGIPGAKIEGTSFLAEFASLQHSIKQMVDQMELRYEHLVASQAAQNQAEERYRAIFMNATEGGFQTTLDGAFLAVNPALARLFKYDSPEDLLRSVANVEQLYIDAADRARFVERLLADGRVNNYVARFKLRDGDLAWHSLNAHVVRSEAGDVLYVEGTTLDVTQRERAEMVTQARLRLMQFSATHSSGELLVAALDEAEKRTDSQVGFFHFLGADQKTLQTRAWSTRTTGEMCKAKVEETCIALDTAGVWADCVRRRRAVVHNDYAALPGRRGLPPGHPPIGRELVVPVFRQGGIVAVLGVGNKPADYVEADVKTVSLLADMAWDIVERKRAEEALRASEERFRVLAEQSQDALFVHNDTGNMLFVNRRACESLGYGREELLGMSVAEIDPDFQVRDDPETIWKSLPRTFESRHRRKDGGAFPVEVRLSAITYGDRRAFFAAVQDITERKRAEEALRENRRLLAAILDTVPQSIAWKDRQSVILGCNKAFARDAGLNNPLDIAGKTDFDLPWLPEEAEAYRADDRQVMETRVGRLNYVEPQVQSDGRRVWLETSKLPLLAESGEANGVVVVYEDITERKRAEEFLYAREQEFRTLVENSPDLIIRYDREFRRVYANPASERITGFKARELLGKTLVEISMLGARTEDYQQRLAEVLESKTSCDFDLELARGGKNASYSIRMVPEFDQAGEAVSVLVIGRDITERKRAEEALHAREQEFRALAENSPDMIVRFDRDLRRTYVNAAWEWGTGLSRNEALGKAIDESSPLGPGTGLYIENIARVLKTGASCEYDLDLPHGQGSLSVSIRMVPELDQSGEVLSVLVIGHDITERKRAEDALRESEERYRGLYQNTPAMLHSMGRDGRLAYVSDTWCEKLGYSREEVLGRNVLDFVTEDSKRIARDISWPQFYATGQVKDIPYQFVARDGTILEILLSATAERDADGTIARSLAVLTDITERKRAEEALRASEERFRAFMDNSPAFGWMKDDAGRYVYMNRAYRDFYHVRDEDALGKTDFERHSGEIANEYWANDRRVLDSGKTIGLEEPTCGLHGEQFVWRCFKFLVTDALGRRFVGGIALDITENKRAEAELYAREQEFRTLAENSPDMIVRFDRDVRRIFVNPAWELGTGVSSVEAHGKTLAQVSPLGPEATDIYVGNVRRVLEMGVPCEQDLDIQRGQEIRSVSVRMVPEFGKGGQVDSVLVIGRDITERKRAEQALRESEDRLRKQLDFLLAQAVDDEAGALSGILEAPAVQVLYDAFVHLTGAAIGLIDVQGQVLVSAGWQDACSRFHRTHPQSRANCMESDTRLVENVRPGEFFAYKCKNNMWDVATPLHIGGRHVANLFTGQFFYEDEQVDFELFSAQADRFGYDREAYLDAVRRVPRFSRAKVDAVMEFMVKLATLLSTLGSGNLKLTRALWDQKQVEQSLRESQLRHQEVFEHSEDAILLKDITAEGRLMIAAINPAGERLLGIKGQSAIGRLVEDALPPDVAARILKNCRRCLEHGEPLHFEEEFQTDAGAVFLQRSLIPLRDSSGRIYRIFSLARDITARRRAEASLRAGEKMKALGTLAGGIAHDFNNILGSVANLAALARSELPTDNIARKDLDRILEAADVGKDLVNQILAFCRLGKTVTRPFDPAQVVRNVLDTISLSMPANIALKTDIPASGGRILGDSSQFHQVVLNLCSNAVDAMRSGSGTLRVSLATATLDEATAAANALPQAGRHVVLKVADTGSGITPEVLARMFEPFFTTKPKGRGTGLGLAVVHGVVSQHQGALVVESQVNQGTTFTVYIPEHETGEPLPPRTKSAPVHGTGRILLVDDDEVLLSSGQRILQGLGYTVTTCAGGDEALALFGADTEAFDMLITDLSMPDLSGQDLAREALSLRAELPVILCTGFGDALSPEEAKRLGIREYVHKPVDWDSLSAVINGLLRNKAE